MVNEKIISKERKLVEELIFATKFNFFQIILSNLFMTRVLGHVNK